MSNKLKKEYKNLKVTVGGMHQSSRGSFFPIKVDCIITNDSNGKTLSIGTENDMYHIRFEDIEKYLK